MNREGIIELVKKVGLYDFIIANPTSEWGCGSDIVYTDPIEELVRLVEKETLERAAAVAENEPKVWDLDAPMPQVRIAMNIRALKTQGD